MELFLTRAFQLILSLSILVLIHELGHFLFARLFRVRVEKFYMFFNPLFSLVRVKRLQGKLRFSWFSRNSPEEFKSEPDKTEFGIGWVPLGGYCSIAGMIDESMNTEQMAQPEQAWEFRSQKPYKRLLIMVGGVLFNFILALILYSAVLKVWGEEYIPMKNATMGLDFSPAAHEAGFKDGDKLISADTYMLEELNEETLRKIASAQNVRVYRDSAYVDLTMPASFMDKIIKGEQGFAALRFPTVVKQVSEKMPASVAGLIPGDSLTAINGKTLATFPAFVQELGKFKNKKIQLTFFRNGKSSTVAITPDENGKLGFVTCMPEDIFATNIHKFTVFSAIPAGIHKGVSKLTGYASDMKYVFTEAGAKSLGGFGTLGKLFPAQIDWEIFWETTAFLSIILAFMNILPIPALDGGHILFLFYEIIFRRKPGDKFMEYAQMTGMFLLLALLVYANGNDLYRWLFK